MFFIFGTARSGTTLLAQTLNLHSQIAVPRETDFIVPLCLILRRVGNEKKGKKLIEEFILGAERSTHSIGEYLKPSKIREAIHRSEYTAASLLKNIYSAIAQSDGKTLGGDKTPNDLLHVNEIINAKTFLDPEIKVIHLVRDPRDVLLSIHNAKLVPLHHSKNFMGRLWSNSNLYLHARLAEKKAQYHLIRYEDFVREPKKHLKEICSFLEIDFEESLLGDKRTKRFKRVSAHANINKPFSTKSIGKWKEGMKPEIVDLIEKQAQEAIEFFGYTD
jgi:hypothetical protein